MDETAKDPLSSDAQTLSWQELLAQGQASIALQHYRLSEAPNGDIFEALKTLATVQSSLREKGYSKARKALEELETRPTLLNWQLLETELEQLELGAKAFDAREPGQGLEAIQDISQPLLRGETETLLGTASVLVNETDKARAHFEEAMRHDPKHYRAITNLGNLALEEGSVDEAIKAYEQALKLNDDFANAHHNLGVAYRRKGQVSKSVRSLRKAQNATQKQVREEARDTFRSGGAKQFAKYGRWFAYGLAAILVYLFLRSRGMI